MKYKLIQATNPSLTPTEQILTNRGIPLKDISHYLHTTDDDINDFKLLDEKKIMRAATALLTAIDRDLHTVIVVDADCDGYTSAAILINYLHDLFPTWTENCLDTIMHEGKQHGLNDCIATIIENNYSLVICPDGGSNDFQEHKTLKEHNIPVLIFDHHDIDCDSQDAIVINIQITDYPNKELSGAGVIWQFCRYLDSLARTNYANEYLDLVALGLTGDMQSLLSIETKHLITKGFLSENIKNPFIQGMWQKNQFKLGDRITSWGAAFYIVPYINAVVRSGTQEEKQIVFDSMLKFKAYNEVPSTKRGHLLNETETILDQALRICTNVKSRQTKIQNTGLEFLEKQIEEKHLLDNKVLLLLVEPGQIDRNVAGLIANKYQSKYQRPCCILTRVEEDGNISYQGSARGCDKIGVSDFKSICLNSEDILYAAGHPGAFGLGIAEEKIDDFIKDTNEALKDINTEPLYYVDYIYHDYDIDSDKILEIATMDELWGKDVDESLIAIEDLKVTKNMLTLMSPDKNPTIKIMLPNGIALIKFNSNQEEYNNLVTEGFVKINAIGKCAENCWNGYITPQILLEDYEITDKIKYLF